MADHGDLSWEQALEREVEQVALNRHRRPHGRLVAVQRDIRPLAEDG